MKRTGVGRTIAKGSCEMESVQFWLGDGCFFGLCPVGGGRIYGFGNVTEPRLRDAVGGRLDRLRERFTGFGGLVGDYLASLETDDQIHCAPIEWLEIDRWHTGRVVLIGDAAHASSPMMGQGGSMAMEDACVLAELLRSTARLTDAVETFVARRRSRVDWVQRQSRAAGEMLDKPPTIASAGPGRSRIASGLWSRLPRATAAAGETPGRAARPPRPAPPRAESPASGPAPAASAGRPTARR